MIFKRVFKWGSIGSLLLFLTLVLISSCVSFDFRMKPAEVETYFKDKGIRASHHRYEQDGRAMHYVVTGDEYKPLVVFVHGSPGSWDNFISFLSNKRLLEHAQLAAPDRPGFGESGFGLHEASLAQQAADIMPLIAAQRHGQPVILVGHSLGAPVIARMAMDYPELIDGLILVAPSIDPQLEKTKWYQIPAQWKVLSWLVPTVLKVTNREILPLKGELEKMLPLWQTITLPVTVIQGGKDKLVPAANADFAARVLKKEQLEMVRVPEMNHFVPWNRPDLIEDAIIQQLERLRLKSNTPL